LNEKLAHASVERTCEQGYLPQRALRPCHRLLLASQRPLDPGGLASPMV
jgi:hypothetical protein